MDVLAVRESNCGVVLPSARPWPVAGVELHKTDSPRNLLAIELITYIDKGVLQNKPYVRYLVYDAQKVIRRIRFDHSYYK